LDPITDPSVETRQGRSAPRRGTCLGRTRSCSNASIPLIDSLCFQQFGASAFALSITQGGSTRWVLRRFRDIACRRCYRAGMAPVWPDITRHAIGRASDF